jgi:hypothetical protein
LKEFRDAVLRKRPGGQQLIQLYNTAAPFLSSLMLENQAIREKLKFAIDALLPFIKSQL